MSPPSLKSSDDGLNIRLQEDQDKRFFWIESNKMKCNSNGG